MINSLNPIRATLHIAYGETYTVVAYWETPSGTLRVFAHRGKSDRVIASYLASESTVHAMKRAGVPMDAVVELMETAKQDINRREGAMWEMLEFVDSQD